MQYGKPCLQGRVGSIACLHRRALASESPEERETGRRANTDAMREARAKESREEGDTRQQANAEAIREARARVPRQEGETRHDLPWDVTYSLGKRGDESKTISRFPFWFPFWFTFPFPFPFPFPFSCPSHFPFSCPSHFPFPAFPVALICMIVTSVHQAQKWGVCS